MVYPLGVFGASPVPYLTSARLFCRLTGKQHVCSHTEDFPTVGRVATSLSIQTLVSSKQFRLTSLNTEFGQWAPVFPKENYEINSQILQLCNFHLNRKPGWKIGVSKDWFMRKDDHCGICYYEVDLSPCLPVVLTKNSILDPRKFSQQNFVKTCMFPWNMSVSRIGIFPMKKYFLETLNHL